jgi:predicted pyridoxine 5'-phosphate oxidase superfamily flavin-nucleotide-binding protein
MAAVCVRDFSATFEGRKACVKRPAAYDACVGLYHDGSRRLQDRFDTRRLADRIEDRIVRDHIDDDDRAFIEARDMFFIATTDDEGRPQSSYKGGNPGFVRVLDERTIAFPVYDGNGMYLTAGNLLVNPNVGLLFIDFEERKRMRLNGTASVDESDPLLAEYPEAQLVVRVQATEVFPNCPRYIHEYRLVQRSRFVPKAECETPVPKWKTSEWAHDVLPEGDPANDPGREVIPRG